MDIDKYTDLQTINTREIEKKHLCKCGHYKGRHDFMSHGKQTVACSNPTCPCIKYIEVVS